jgi:hypothetical protein
VRISALVLSTSTASHPVVFVLDVSGHSQMRRRRAGVTLLFASMLLGACRETPIARNGPTQRRIVARTYARSMHDVRTAILNRYPKVESYPVRPDNTYPDLFHVLSISEQPPPGFQADWLAAYVDPSGFLEPYRRLTPAEQANDLVLREATGDRYWLSEYEANGQAVKFKCGLIVHFVESAPGTTEAQVFEVVPTVWVGQHWAWAKEGFGPGRFHDIRFVDPTVRDREAMLAFIDSILK